MTTEHPMTAAFRKAIVPEMPAELAKAQAAGEPTWDSKQFLDEFTPLGFMAPFVAVVRKADQVKGSLQFTHSPRVYFGWQAD